MCFDLVEVTLCRRFALPCFALLCFALLRSHDMLASIRFLPSLRIYFALLCFDLSCFALFPKYVSKRVYFTIHALSEERWAYVTPAHICFYVHDLATSTLKNTSNINVFMHLLRFGQEIVQKWLPRPAWHRGEIGALS